MSVGSETQEVGCEWVSVKGFAIFVSTTQNGILVEIHDERLLDMGEQEDSLMTSNFVSSAGLSKEVSDGTV